MTSSNAKRWFYKPQPNPSAKLKVVCFHYAGGAAQSYRPWGSAFGSDVEVLAVQLPGRADRLDEKPIDQMDVLIQELRASIIDVLNTPFVLFGQCVGGLVAFELARELRKYNKSPLALFASAILAPHAPHPLLPVKDLPDDEFLKELTARTGQGPNMALLGDPRFRDIFMNYLRADSTIREYYEYKAAPAFDFPIFAFAGDKDPEISEKDLLQWQEHTNKKLITRLFAGDRFYWMSEPKPLFLEMNNLLTDLKKQL